VVRERLTGLRRIDPTAVDTGFALLVAFGTCLAGSQYHDARWPHFDAPAYLFSVLACLPMALRRRIPLLALALSCAAFAGYLAAGYQPSINWFAPPLILYTVVALRPLREAAAGAVLTGAVIFYSGWCADLPPAVIVVQPIVLVGIAWLLGGGARALADRNRRLAVLTARLRDEQRDRAARAVTEERVRIARELHDVVAHHMSVITVQAGLAQYVFAADPATARTALDVIADAGRQAQQEMRYLLAALRIGPEQPGDEAPLRAPAGCRSWWAACARPACRSSCR
jgi:signal transduction histidine kinase